MDKRYERNKCWQGHGIKIWEIWKQMTLRMIKRCCVYQQILRMEYLQKPQNFIRMSKILDVTQKLQKIWFRSATFPSSLLNCLVLASDWGKLQQSTDEHQKLDARTESFKFHLKSGSGRNLLSVRGLAKNPMNKAGQQQPYRQRPAKFYLRWMTAINHWLESWNVFTKDNNNREATKSLFPIRVILGRNPPQTRFRRSFNRDCWFP